MGISGPMRISRRRSGISDAKGLCASQIRLALSILVGGEAVGVLSLDLTIFIIKKEVWYGLLRRMA